MPSGKMAEPTALPSMGRSEWRALYSACITLALGVLGSTVLPVPYAFSQTGVVIGCLTMALVAFCNVRTCFMMTRAAAHTGLDTYEALAEWAAGPRFRILTQVSLIVLLYGTMCGGMAFLSDICRGLAEKGLKDDVPQLLSDDGRPVLVVITLLVLLPLCLQRHIRQIETAATFGFGVVVALCAIIISKAVQTGFPAIKDGELPLFSLRVDKKVFEAFAVLGFAFYVQPMLMPLCKEMPPGRIGAVLIEHATRITLYGVACVTYGIVGIFGAAIYGQHTESNILVNDLVTGRGQIVALYIALILYLCVGMVTTHYALRASLDILIFGPNKPFAWSRQIALTCGGLGASLAVAMAFPTAAEKIFALTGCSAVCVVCYVVPCVIDIKLLHHLDQHDHSHAMEGAPGGSTLSLADGQDEAGTGLEPSDPLLKRAAPPAHTRRYLPPHDHDHDADVVGPAAPAAHNHAPGSCTHDHSHDHSHGPHDHHHDHHHDHDHHDHHLHVDAEAGAGGRSAGGSSGGGAGTPGGHGMAPPFRTLWSRLGVLYQELLTPCLLVAVGVGFSLAGLYVALTDLLASLHKA